MDSVFLTQFLMISDVRTVLFIGLLIVLFAVIKQCEKKRISFSSRMMVGIGLGLVLGLAIQFTSGFADNPMEIRFVSETTKWYSLVGNGFIDLIRMLVIPLVMVSIIHVIINMKEGANIGKMARNTVITALSMVFIATIVGFVVGILFNVGSGMAVEGGTAEIREVENVVDTLRGLLPANPAQAMVEVNIISLVIVSAFFGTGARRMSKKYMETVKPFYDLINALQKIIVSIAMTIIKWMPYAVVALLANTIAQRGVSSIVHVGLFILAIYVALVIMFGIQLAIVASLGLNPITFIKKGTPAFILAFTSRSSVGTLPLTIETLSEEMGINDGTASFVAGFGTTAGMQACAGIFPAMVIVFVANMTGMAFDFSFLAMSVVVMVIGSLGIAGVPGSATMAASVTLSGVGLASLFPLMSPVFAVDPIVDMGRTMINVSGSITNALIVEKSLGQLDTKRFNEIKKKDSKADSE